MWKVEIYKDGLWFKTEDYADGVSAYNAANVWGDKGYGTWVRKVER